MRKQANVTVPVSGTALLLIDVMLHALRIKRVILTGIAGNICVLFTANDAYMRELKIFAPTASSRTPPAKTITPSGRSPSS